MATAPAPWVGWAGVPIPAAAEALDAPAGLVVVSSERMPMSSTLAVDTPENPSSSIVLEQGVASDRGTVRAGGFLRMMSYPNVLGSKMTLSSY